MFTYLRRQRYHGGRTLYGSTFGTAFRTPETLQLVIAEMRKAGIGLNGLSVGLSASTCGDTKSRVHKLIEEFLGSRHSPLNLRFTWNDGLDKLVFNHSQSHLSSASSLLFNPRSKPIDVLPLDEVIQWFAAKSFLKLSLQDLHIGRLGFLDRYLPRSLQSITLDDIRLGSVLFAEGFYSSLFEHLAEMPYLKHCEFRRLRYMLPMERHPDDHVMRLYTFILIPTKFESLLLVFPNGKLEIEILGADTPRQLEDLAAYTAAAERKVQEVQAARRVDHYRVIVGDVPFPKEMVFEYV